MTRATEFLISDAMENTCKIDPQTAPGTRQAIEWLLNEGGVSAEFLDGADGNPQDGILTTDEFIHFVYNSPEWRKYLPALRQAGLKHPLDRGAVAPMLMTGRAQTIAGHIVRHILLDIPETTRTQEDFCAAFVPAFFTRGLETYAEGGLGWGYPLDYAERDLGNELTVAEASAAVLTRKLPFGECTEATYKIISDFSAAGVLCPVEAIQTQNHVFARSGGIDLDPSGLGKIGWEKLMTESRLASSYYSNLAHAAKTPEENALYRRMADAIEPNSFSAHISRGVNLLNIYRLNKTDGQTTLDEAYQKICEAIDTNPDNPENFMWVKKLLDQLEPDVNLRWARDLIRRYPDNAYAVVMFRNNCLSRGVCAQEAQELMKSLPNSGNGEFLMAIEALRANKHDQMLPWIEASMQKNPDNAVTLQMKAQLVMDRGDIDEAETLFLASSKIAPNLAGNHAGLSAVYSRKGQVVEAYDQAKRESLVFHDNPAADLSLSNAALAAGDLATAKLYGEKYVKRIPHDPSGHLALSNVSLNQGDLDQAISHVRTAVEASRYPAVQARTRAVLANLYLMKPDLTQASAELKRALAIDPHNLSAMIVHVYTLMSQNRFPEALGIANDLVRNFPGFADSWAIRSLVNQTMNRRDAALNDLTRAIEKDPNNLVGLRVMLYVLQEGGHVDDVIICLNKTRSLSKTNPFLHAVDADVSYFLGDKNHALREALVALKYNPHDPTAWITLGLIQLDWAVAGKTVHEKTGGLTPDDPKYLARAEEIGQKLKQLYPLQNIGALLMARVQQLRGNLFEAEAEAREAVRLFPYDNGLIPKTSAYQALIEILDAEGKTTEAAAAREAMMKNRH